jgi:hypothetical protein
MSSSIDKPLSEVRIEVFMILAYVVQRFTLTLSNGLNAVITSPPFHLRTETDPVSETLCFLYNTIVSKMSGSFLVIGPREAKDAFFFTTTIDMHLV